MHRQRERERIIEQMEKQQNARQLWQCLFQTFSDEGFDRIIHLSGDTRRIQIVSNFDASWNEYYIEKGFMERDPFLRYCTTSYRTVRTGIDHVREHPYLNDAEIQVIEEASECGFRSGFSSTLQRFDGNQVNAWNIGSHLNAAEVTDILQEKLPYLQMISYYGSLFAANLHHPNPVVDVADLLTARERRCLELSACGLRTRDIAELLKRSEATIEFHLRNAREKLGARTREHAIYLAMKLNLISP
ncbi:MAG: LuxR family transcriptional regulator [Saccharospirillaceae bacterium]|nr:LuxR family transcriptional regulator [Saccharospirillaceae bacterium]MCD8532695.1 LuxR family transcriptional regulator [Saccharospirillaceae bacterium]